MNWTSGRNGTPPPHYQSTVDTAADHHTEPWLNHEREPLLPPRDDQNDQRSRGKRSFSLKGLALCAIVSVLIAGNIAGPIIIFKSAKLDTCPEAEAMDRLRGKWTLEERLHNVTVEERQQLYELWRVEDATHTAKINFWAEEDLEREEIRKEWHLEVIEHERKEHEREEVRKEWQCEAVEHERFERERQQREAREHEEARQKWEREVIEHECEERERRKREWEERQKMGFFWMDIEATHCVRYGTRKYTARLANVPDGFEPRVEACEETELSINGKVKGPTRCEDRVGLGVYGIWEVEGDAACSTWFNWFTDNGCTAPSSGLRKYSMYMEDLRQGDDWEVMCSSTPVTFNEMYFAHPDTCYQRNAGTYGVWNVRDTSCW
ncbi:hypothetical protein CONPUDRAFT_140369 [Coniophora puteana RWD-64-598 SS2]|uniref:Uncharacterized protein n=1 Tax=Coniophora puteana (strain RWD-64-598) TaxID=741705 RepID=R7SEB4_CONPW|nr:uncharacterized protein CONPUDRAFT_140369 [Coniophora puteana RWD-64-598 SS2]EIW74518.1 hypothetical protein CONPUDRAFT_140369 [Coniophora puteana RWD-64-598 SS2]